MTVYATMYVWQCSKQKGAALLALLALADFANRETGECFPSVPTLANMLRMKDRNVQTLLRTLEKAGEIKTAPNAGVHTPTGNTNHYTLVGYKSWYEQTQKIKPQSDQEMQEFAPLNNEAVQDTAPLETSSGANLRHEGVQEFAPKPSLEPKKKIKDSATKKVAGGVAQEKQKLTRPRNLLFDIVAKSSFDIKDTTGLDKKIAGRIARISTWLAKKEVTPEYLERFYRWYDREKKGASRPRDLTKFAENFTAYDQKPKLVPKAPDAPGEFAGVEPSIYGFYHQPPQAVS